MATATKKQGLTPNMKAHIMGFIYEALGDPDLGLELTNEFKKRFRASQNKHQKWVSHAELKKRLLGHE